MGRIISVKKRKKTKRKKKKKKKAKRDSVNPLSLSFNAVDYLKHRTPLYQVNTINIDNIHERRGELSTAQFVVGDWKFRVLVYPFGVDNVDCTMMNNQYMSVYLHYLGRTDERELCDEQIQTEFRCTIHSCLGSQQDMFQELQHKFGIAKKEKFLSGFKQFLPLPLLLRTPFYMFPDPKQQQKEKQKKKKKKKKSDDGDETNEAVATEDELMKDKQAKRNMVILKTELWIFPPLDWKKSKAAPKSPIYIDLLDDDSDEEEAKNDAAVVVETKEKESMPSLENDAVPELESTTRAQDAGVIDDNKIENVNANDADVDG